MKFVDPTELSKAMTNIAERSQRLVLDFLTKQAANGSPDPLADPLNIGEAFFQMTTKMMADPAKLMEAQMGLWQDYMQLWQNTARRLMGEESTAGGPTRQGRPPIQGRDVAGKRSLSTSSNNPTC